MLHKIKIDYDEVVIEYGSIKNLGFSLQSLIVLQPSIVAEEARLEVFAKILYT